ncbi:hypothetical protein B0H17DRAFT_1053143 [Mycena rosella]|uniref:Uncharacterized protein n=1 Tax=Mycena rosella TaxID=1033263 RepID=A0AAD7GIR0_MYCRO|nr:hypothetical protein B0H17DRAFT_1053143 [Mycena rosella]
MTDVANFIAHHPPAIKVGGRRLSVSTKHKSHPAPEQAPAAPAQPAEVPAVDADYPRPAAPTGAGVEEPAHVPPPPYIEDEPPRKEKKHDTERKLMELAQRKAEMTRPTRDLKNTGKGFGGAGRIAQPMKDLRV